MPVKITRHGGPMVMKPTPRTISLEDIDAPTRAALDELLAKSTPSQPNERTPDGFVYSIEVEEAGKPARKAELSSPNIPDALRKLLP